MPEPPQSKARSLVDAIALGICGTDREIIAGDYGEAPPDAERPILGRESLGRVREAPAASGYKKAIIVGIVRERDPVPCMACANGNWTCAATGNTPSTASRR